MIAHSSSASGRDKRSAQPRSSENIPRRASPGVKFSVRVFADVFTWPDYYSAMKLSRIPFLPREEIKEVHSHQVQKIFRNVLRRGLNFRRTSSQMHSPGRNGSYDFAYP
jgi:hypothetical protein